MHEKNIAMRNDSRLFDVATYCVSKGLTVPIDVKKIEEVHIKFAEFKRLVKKEGMTIAQIEGDVYKKYGIMNTSEENIENFLGAVAGLDKALRERDKRDKRDKRNENNKSNSKKEKNEGAS